MPPIFYSTRSSIVIPPFSIITIFPSSITRIYSINNRTVLSVFATFRVLCTKFYHLIDKPGIVFRIFWRKQAFRLDNSLPSM